MNRRADCLGDCSWCDALARMVNPDRSLKGRIRAVKHDELKGRLCVAAKRAQTARQQHKSEVNVERSTIRGRDSPAVGVAGAGVFPCAASSSTSAATSCQRENHWPYKQNNETQRRSHPKTKRKAAADASVRGRGQDRSEDVRSCRPTSAPSLRINLSASPERGDSSGGTHTRRAASAAKQTTVQSPEQRASTPATITRLRSCALTPRRMSLIHGPKTVSRVVNSRSTWRAQRGRERASTDRAGLPKQKEQSEQSDGGVENERASRHNPASGARTALGLSI